MNGHFLSLEGVEGVGKTTNLKFIVDYLSDQGINVVQTREPGGTLSGERIRELLLDPDVDLLDDTELLLMFASRAELVKKTIQPALAQGDWVVSDRFTDASFAYQGGGRQLGFKRVASLESWVLGSFRPDTTLFLDLPVQKGLDRVNQRPLKDRIELEPTAFFDRVRAAYHQRIADDPKRFRVIDASVPLVSVQAEIKRVLDDIVTRHASLAASSEHQ